MGPNGVLIHGKNNPNLRRWCCFRVKQSNSKLISISDPEICSVRIYIHINIKFSILVITQ